jgi:iron complex outermembrane receptor protein
MSSIALRLLTALAGAGVTGLFAIHASAQTVALPGIEVITTSPLPGGDIERDKVPANTQTMGPQDLDHAKSQSVAETLLQRVPSVAITDTAVNPFQPDVQYRGFVASPTIGTPQGLAVYQNGVRVNEAFGDTVNWDFIPEAAVNRMTLHPSNPLFGLNALGGALAVEMKDGFNYRGAETEVRGGSFGRRAVTSQAGYQNGNVAGYFAADVLRDEGWRDRSSSRIGRFYADVGVKEDRGEFHVNFTGASNFFGAAAPTPIEMLNRRWRSVYTTPQTTGHDLAMFATNGTYKLTDTIDLKGNLYYRRFRQRHVDGNTSDVVPCDPGLFPGFLCFDEDDDPLFAVGGAMVPDILGGGTPGSIDRTSTKADAYGGSAQANSTGQIFGRPNNLVVGASLDRGKVNFGATSELGIIQPDLFVTGTGVIIAQPAGDVAPVALKTRNTYTGLYVTDTLDVTSALSVTAGGRFNFARIKLEDQLGTDLNGSHDFSRFNPVVGATYKILPNLTAYAGYSEANRAPTPAELGCADPLRPCLLDNFLVADPPLRQVISRTKEAGLRGHFDFGEKNGRLAWSLGAFRADNEDDIINVPSAITGRGFFVNAGGTRRQGVEAQANYASSRWNAYASYNYLEATFRDMITLASPANPAAVGGLITVMPGDFIPAVPQHRFKAGAEFWVLPEKWKLGFDAIGVGSQYFVGDESNQNPKLPSYWVVNLHTTYKLHDNIEVFGLVQNLFDKRYYTFGTFFDTSEVAFLGLTDPRSVSPGAPLAIYGGLRAKL